MSRDDTFLRIRASLCEFSVVDDLDEYAAHICLVVLDARERARRAAA